MFEIVVITSKAIEFYAVRMGILDIAAGFDEKFRLSLICFLFLDGVYL